MSLDSLVKEFGHLHKVEEVAKQKLLPGNADVIRAMCATGELGHTPKYGPKGEVRYWISDNDIRAWLSKHHQRASI